MHEDLIEGLERFTELWTLSDVEPVDFMRAGLDGFFANMLHRAAYDHCKDVFCNRLPQLIHHIARDYLSAQGRAGRVRAHAIAETLSQYVYQRVVKGNISHLYLEDEDFVAVMDRLYFIRTTFGKCLSVLVTCLVLVCIRFLARRLLLQVRRWVLSTLERTLKTTCF